MSYSAVNWLAIILATVVSWGFGAGWYMLLAKQWTAAIGKKPEDIDRADYSPYLWSVLCLFIMAYFIALLTPALLGSLSVTNGLLVGFHMWLAFVVTSMLLNHRYQGAPWALTAIDGGYLLAVLLIDGAIIGVFG